MSNFARVDENNIVVEVIVASQDFINSGVVGPKEQWIECATNHTIRGRYPGIGYTYDRFKEEFFPPKPPEFPSWVWNNVNGPEGRWVAPVPFPGNAVNGKLYDWDEATVSWIEKTDESAQFLLKETEQIVQLNMGTTFIVPSNANVPPEI